jgi:hypothetical protein
VNKFKKKERVVHENCMYACFLGNDGESDSRTAVSRSASAAASMFSLRMNIVLILNISIEILYDWFFCIEVVSSKSDTMKSTTSSSAASSREVYSFIL